MHRAAFHFIKALGVPSRVTRTGKRKRTQNAAEVDDAELEDGDAENDVDDEEMLEVDTDIDISMDVDASADDAEGMAETLEVDFEPGDTIGKLLAFVNQVRMSSEDVREYLAHSCRIHTIKPIELRLWVRSRWGSLSHCLSATLEVQKVCCFFLLRHLLSTLYCRPLTIFVSLRIPTRISHLSRTNHGLTIGCREGNGNLLSWYSIA
jgi:hypothetical protein